MKRLAVVLFNLGGPDGPDAIKPFLYNLFSDPAIISVPQPLRWLLAKYISAKRVPFAQEIYKHMGGSSPILELTQAQGLALQNVLAESFPDREVEVFISMRYWHPFSAQTVQEVKTFNPDQVVLLPLYPQFSTTTTESSFIDWKKAAAAINFDVLTKRVCCYPTEPGFIQAQAELLKEAVDQAKSGGDPVRVLFSAHGLPKKIVDKKSDPYPHHVEQGATAIIDFLASQDYQIDDWQISYQSRVGPLEWIGPSTENEIIRAGQDKVGLVILPLAFVSEHSETLVELDIEYKQVAIYHNVSPYVRVPAVGTHPKFIGGLKDIVINTLDTKGDVCAQGKNKRLCGDADRACPLRAIG